MTTEGAKRVRKSKEERLAELAEKKRQIELRAKQQLDAMEAKIRRLQQSSHANRAAEKERKALMKQIFQLVPDWEPIQVLGAVARMKQEAESNPHVSEQLKTEGQAQQQQLQSRRGRRGRRPASNTL